MSETFDNSQTIEIQRRLLSKTKTDKVNMLIKKSNHFHKILT